MALTKVQAEGINLADTFAFSGTLSGLPSGADAFCANGGSSSWASDAAGGIVAFTNDSSNDNFDTGNRFDTSTYKYTARVDGVYLFWYAIYTAQNDSDNGFGFLKNSTAVHMDYLSASYFTYHGNDVTDHVMNATLIIPLTASDTMAVTCRLQSDYYRGYSMFGGCRLA